MPQTPNSKPKTTKPATPKPAQPKKAPAASTAKKTVTATKKASPAKSKPSSKPKVAKSTTTASASGKTAAKPTKKTAAPRKNAKAKMEKKAQEQSNWLDRLSGGIESRGSDIKSFNNRLLDIAHKDTDQFFDMSRAVVRATSWPEVFEIQAQYVSDRINCYRPDQPDATDTDAKANVFAWIAKQANAALTGSTAPRG